jgi:hypothetical protein
MLPFLFFCTASIQQRTSRPGLTLRSFNKIAVVLQSSSGSTSLHGAKIGGIAGGHVMNGNTQAQHALESMKFELMGIGFDVLDEAESADAIAEFSIGAIRYDPLAGWIADQAFLKFKDASSVQSLN